MSKEAAARIKATDTIPETGKDLIVIIEPFGRFKEARVIFSPPVFEPILSYVSQAIMLKDGPRTMIFNNLSEAGSAINIIDWDPASRELRVKITDDSFGTQ